MFSPVHKFPGNYSDNLDLFYQLFLVENPQLQFVARHSRNCDK